MMILKVPPAGKRTVTAENGTFSNSLDFYMGKRPSHFPKTRFALEYSGDYLFLRFDVADRYVISVAKEHQDKVFLDSCVEFFFTPGTDLNKGYFNLEANCGGKILFHFQNRKTGEKKIVASEDLSKIEIKGTMPPQVYPEIKEPVNWALEIKIPIIILQNYCEADRPAAGVKWRANFYKCADYSSHPHWLTWNKVNYPEPDFHRPESFGLLEFE